MRSAAPSTAARARPLFAGARIAAGAFRAPLVLAFAGVSLLSVGVGSAAEPAIPRSPRPEQARVYV
ncbi:hypothetical protein K2X89_12720, partial [Myxococcota bacterium]|nr:hypothetical protein [Myxococcota bacterium]